MSTERKQPHKTPEAATVDRRQYERQPIRTDLKVRVPSQALEGQSDNLSRSGVMFFTDEPLQVEIEMVEDGEKLHFRGHLVRCQIVAGRRTGYAVEFEEVE